MIFFQLQCTNMILVKHASKTDHESQKKAKNKGVPNRLNKFLLLLTHLASFTSTWQAFFPIVFLAPGVVDLALAVTCEAIISQLRSSHFEKSSSQIVFSNTHKCASPQIFNHRSWHRWGWGGGGDYTSQTIILKTTIVFETFVELLNSGAPSDFRLHQRLLGSRGGDLWSALAS